MHEAEGPEVEDNSWLYSEFEISLSQTNKNETRNTKISAVKVLTMFQNIKYGVPMI